jgi:hypothetical protein
MKTRWIDICRASLAVVVLLLLIGVGFVCAQEQEVTVTYDSLPSGWSEMEVNPGLLLKLHFDEKSSEGFSIITVRIREKLNTLSDWLMTAAGCREITCESGETTVDGYPAFWAKHFEDGSELKPIHLIYQIDVGLNHDNPRAIEIWSLICAPGVCGPIAAYDPNIELTVEETREMINRLHFHVSGAGESCSAQISYPTDLRPGDILMLDVFFMDSNNQVVDPLSYSIYIDGEKTSQVIWSGNATSVVVDYVCPNGEKSRETITIPGSGSEGIEPIEPPGIEPIAPIEPIEPIEPSETGNILGPLAIVGGIAVGLAGAGVVGGAIVIRTIKKLNQPPNGKKPPEKKEDEKEEKDKLLGYDLGLSAQRLTIRQGDSAQLVATGTAYYKRSGEKPAPEMAITISLPPKASGLEAVPMVGSGQLACTIAMVGEIDSRQVALIVAGQAPGWQDEKRVILEIEQNYQVRFF